MSQASGPSLNPHPSERVRQAVERWGEPELISRCVTLFRTTSCADAELLVQLAGEHGQRFVDLGLGKEGYWLRVWPLRVMLYAWHPSAEPAVVDALADEHWRVREMAAKVVVHREIGAAAEAVADLADDPVPRVRAAAARALGVVGETEHVPALRVLLADPEPAVRNHADRALTRLAARLDRSPDELRNRQRDR